MSEPAPRIDFADLPSPEEGILVAAKRPEDLPG